jgi:hypothetical protein
MLVIMHAGKACVPVTKEGIVLTGLQVAGLDTVTTLE